MSKSEVIQGVVLNDDVILSFVEVCHQCQLPEDILMDWIAHGLLGDEISTSVQAAQFNHEMINRIRSASRLHHELEVNIQGVVLVLELLDQIADMRDQLTILKRI